MTHTRVASAPGFRRARPRWMKHSGFLIGSITVGAIVLMAAFGPLLWGQDPYDQNLLERMTPPFWMDGGGWEHPLGTDHLGRDYLARLLYGARLALLVGLSTALISGIIGTTLGVAAGYFGGWVDTVISFVITARLAIPVILVALALVALAGSSLLMVILVLGFLLWDRFAIVMRATTQQIRSADYITAARVQGCSTWQIICHEILPNVGSNLAVVATLEIAHAIVLEAALSFLGLGIPPPTPTWGLMIAEGRENVFFDAWLINIPGVALFLLVLATNLAGDGLRDVTTPEGRN